jgi:hypothetical protein
MDDEDLTDNVKMKKDTKDLRTILNRGKLDRFELDEFLNG